MSDEMIHAICMLGGFLFVIGFCVIIFLILRSICRGLKNFLFELIDHINGSSPTADTSKQKYTYEAQRACEKVTPERKQGTKPPWEE